MDSWIETARQAVSRSEAVRQELRNEATTMLANGEREAATRIFEGILEEEIPDLDRNPRLATRSIKTGT